jgi:hypothetical protein
MHETYIHTVFEPSAKKHLSIFSCFVKKEDPWFVKIMISMLRREIPHLCASVTHKRVQVSVNSTGVLFIFL